MTIQRYQPADFDELPTWLIEQLPARLAEQAEIIQHLHVHSLLEIRMGAPWRPAAFAIGMKLAEMNDAERAAHWRGVRHRLAERTKRVGGFTEPMRNLTTPEKRESTK